MRLRRASRRHQAGVDSSLWYEFNPGDRVLTREGIFGRVVAVEDGPHPGNEQYVVELDAGLGGGEYSASELRHPTSDHVEPGFEAAASKVAQGTERYIASNGDEGHCSVCGIPISYDDYEGDFVTPCCGAEVCEWSNVSGYQCYVYDSLYTGQVHGETITVSSKTAATVAEPGPEVVEEGETCLHCGQPIYLGRDGEWYHSGSQSRECDPDFVVGSLGGHVASDDYPELSEILVERPPLPHSERVASKTAIALAKRYRCKNERIPMCDRGDGSPPRKKCRNCGSEFYIEEGLYGVFDWRGDNRYDPADAKSWHKTDDKATAAAEGEEVSRWIPASMLGGVTGGSKTARYVVVDDGGFVVAGPFQSRARAMEELEFFQADDPRYDYYVEREGADHYAAKEGGFFDRILEPIADRMIENQNPNTRYNPQTGQMASYDWCRFRRDRHCYYPRKLNEQATQEAGYPVWVPEHRGLCPWESWEDQKACPAPSEPGPNANDPRNLTDATIPWEAGGQRYDERGVPVKISPYGVKTDPANEVEEVPVKEVSDTSVAEDLSEMISEHRERKNPYISNPYTSSRDPEFTFHFTAAWADVQQKASRIRQEGHVRVISASPAYLVGEVRGDTNIYQATLHREPGSNRISLWECGCAWAAYSWGRSGRWKKYEGRMCSHALALHYEGQARGWGGGSVTEDASLPNWRSDPSITVKVPGDYKRPNYGEWRVDAARKMAERAEWISSLHRVDTDPFLREAPAVTMARLMRQDGDSADEIAQTLSALGVASPQPFMKAAGIEASFTVQYHGQTVKVVKLVGGGDALLDTGEVVDIGEINHPNFHPNRGLASKFAQADSEDGCMIAFRPPAHILDALEGDTDEDYDELHVTVAYLGKAADIDHNLLNQAVAEWSRRWPAHPAKLSGYGVFENGPERVLVALVDMPGFEDARDDLLDKLAAVGIYPMRNHGYTPHLTLAYGEGVKAPESMPEEAKSDFQFSSVYVVYGGEWEEIPFTGRGVMKAATSWTSQSPNGKRLDSPEDAFAFEGELKDDPEPALPETTGDEVDASDFTGEETDLADQPHDAPASIVQEDPDLQGERMEVEGVKQPEWLNPNGGGGGKDRSNSDIAQAAREFLAKTALKDFTPAEQRMLIEEGESEGVVASNLDRLDITGTHYETLEEAMQMADASQDDEVWLSL